MEDNRQKIKEDGPWTVATIVQKIMDDLKGGVLTRGTFNKGFIFPVGSPVEENKPIEKQMMDNIQTCCEKIGLTNVVNRAAGLIAMSDSDGERGYLFSVSLTSDRKELKVSGTKFSVSVETKT